MPYFDLAATLEFIIGCLLSTPDMHTGCKSKAPSLHQEDKQANMHLPRTRRPPLGTLCLLGIRCLPEIRFVADSLNVNSECFAGGDGPVNAMQETGIQIAN
jgi:hypothetical protein